MNAVRAFTAENSIVVDSPPPAVTVHKILFYAPTQRPRRKSPAFRRKLLSDTPIAQDEYPTDNFRASIREIDKIITYFQNYVKSLQFFFIFFYNTTHGFKRGSACYSPQIYAGFKRNCLVNIFIKKLRKAFKFVHRDLVKCNIFV